jgi:hypothetical protein
MKKYFIFLFAICSVAVNSWAQFQPGYYYDKAGQKKVGLIKHKFGADTFSSGPDNSIVFKENKKADRIELTTDDIKAFVIESDSFAILRGFSINSLAFYSSDFVKVVQTGKIDLYWHYTTVPTPRGGSLAITFLLKRKGLVKAIFKKDFKEQFQTIFAEHKELVSRIEKKQLDFDDLEQIVKEYNQYMNSQAK